MDRLHRQIDFLLTCDRLKSVVRQNHLHDGSRAENSAEHSWHLALMALTLAEHAAPGTDMGRVVELLLTHDLVEVYAGDAYFELPGEAMAAHLIKEAEAAEQLFALLPEDQRGHFRTLWDEFEARATAEARFARALDVLQPVLMTWGPGGVGTHQHPELTAARVLQRKHTALAEFPALWTLLEQTLVEAQTAVIFGERPIRSRHLSA